VLAVRFFFAEIIMLFMYKEHFEDLEEKSYLHSYRAKLVSDIQPGLKSNLRRFQYQYFS
jgi:hypothetical protein